MSVSLLSESLVYSGEIFMFPIAGGISHPHLLLPEASLARRQ